MKIGKLRLMEKDDLISTIKDLELKLRIVRKDLLDIKNVVNGIVYKNSCGKIQ